MQEALQMLKQEEEGRFSMDMEGDESKNENSLEDESQEVFLRNTTMLQKIPGGFSDKNEVFLEVDIGEILQMEDMEKQQLVRSDMIKKWWNKKEAEKKG